MPTSRGGQCVPKAAWTQTIQHPAVTKVVHHDAKTKVVHHDAKTKVVHHDAKTKVVHHDAVTRTDTVPDQRYSWNPQGPYDEDTWAPTWPEPSQGKWTANTSTYHAGDPIGVPFQEGKGNQGDNASWFYWSTKAITVEVEQAYDETVEVEQAYDETVEIEQAYDETVEIEQAYDETVEEKAAWTETVSTRRLTATSRVTPPSR